MKRTATLSALAAAALMALAASPALAQEEAQGPGQRVVTTTSFQVPFGPMRADVVNFMNERWLPAMQLNPKVLNLRVMFHNWGSDASMVVVAAEYAEFADIDADCGAPCDEYYDANPAPEAGTPEREEFDRKLKAWQKVYSHHQDQIMVAPMGMAKVEGEIMGTVGGADEGNGN